MTSDCRTSAGRLCLKHRVLEVCIRSLSLNELPSTQCNGAAEP